jgi:hypothetical protein
MRAARPLADSGHSAGGRNTFVTFASRHKKHGQTITRIYEEYQKLESERFSEIANLAERFQPRKGGSAGSARTIGGSVGRNGRSCR